MENVRDTLAIGIERERREVMLRHVTLSAAVLAAFVICDRAHACTCAGPPSPMEAFDASAAVFAGKVISVESTGGTGSMCTDVVIVTMTSDASWKGPTLPVMKLRTPANDGCCGLNFAVGVPYLIYATNSTYFGGLSAMLCSRTRTLATAEEDLEWLGTPNSRTPSELGTWGAIKALYE